MVERWAVGQYYGRQHTAERVAMPIVDHGALPETPWRPRYRKWDVTREGDGTTSSSLSLSVVESGAGAPLHTHRADELIVVLEGSLDVRIGDETHRVGPDHTLVVPPDVAHGFTSVGPGPARLMAFFPVSNPFDHTTFLEGEPPEAHRP